MGLQWDSSTFHQASEERRLQTREEAVWDIVPLKGCEVGLD